MKKGKSVWVLDRLVFGWTGRVEHKLLLLLMIDEQKEQSKIKV